MSVVAVSAGADHGPNKPARPVIELLRGVGVAGDAHAGKTVQHRSRARAHPHWPNLRQVHLLNAELLDELRARGFDLAPGQLGENVLAAGIDLLALPEATVVRLGPDAAVRITGLRNPCSQLDTIHEGLMAAVLARAADGSLRRRAGVMGVVLSGGSVRPGDPITLTLPVPPHRALDPV